MGNQEKYVIICSGDLMHTDVSEIIRDAVVICADGGINRAEMMGIQADVLIGDGDSMTHIEHVKYKTFIELPTEKDMSDTAACISYAAEQGCKEIHLLCCTGGRMDHMLSNIYLLESLYNLGIQGYIHDDFNEITVIGSGRYYLDKSDKYKYLSLIALDSVATGVTLEGLKYPLTDAVLTRTDPSFGVSNEIITDRCSITIGSGRCVLIRSRDRV